MKKIRNPVRTILKLTKDAGVSRPDIFKHNHLIAENDLKHSENVKLIQPALVWCTVYLGERPPWEQLVGEVSGLLWLLGCRGGVRPAELLGDTCK